VETEVDGLSMDSYILA